MHVMLTLFCNSLLAGIPDLVSSIMSFNVLSYCLTIANSFGSAFFLALTCFDALGSFLILLPKSLAVSLDSSLKDELNLSFDLPLVGINRH